MPVLKSKPHMLCWGGFPPTWHITAALLCSLATTPQRCIAPWSVHKLCSPTVMKHLRCARASDLSLIARGSRIRWAGISAALPRVGVMLPHVCMREADCQSHALTVLAPLLLFASANGPS